MVNYKGKKLIKTAGKSGGKNQSQTDGFYKDESGTETQGQEYFIKKPGDKKELFTELFAGLLLNEFKSLIDPRYSASLICADLIKFDDDSYGLIQPKVAFTELYKVIGTGNKNGSDRDPLFEMRVGPSQYMTLTQQGEYFGLSMALMFSLLLGDHSVHSGNVVVLIPASTTDPKQFGRIDWGAAFRDFAHDKNNTEDIFDFYQYQGWFNVKKLTQGYFDNYKNIEGLFSSVANKANGLITAMETKTTMNNIVHSALGKIPADLIDQSTRVELARYLAIPSFAEASFGADGNYGQISEKFSQVLTTRLSKIAAIKRTIEESQLSTVYQSVLPRPADAQPSLPSAVDFETYHSSQQSLDEHSEAPSNINNAVAVESPCFFSMNDEELLAISHEQLKQLITICLKDLDENAPNIMVSRILKNHRLWNKVENYFKDTVNCLSDNPEAKINQLQQWHKLLEAFWAQNNNFSLLPTFAEKKLGFQQLEACFQTLPPFLQADSETQQYIGSAKSIFVMWLSRNENYLEKEHRFLAERSIVTYEALDQAFKMLPSDLQQNYQEKMKDYQQETIYIQKRDAYKQQESFTEAHRSFTKLIDIFNQLPAAIKSTYQQEFDHMRTAWQDHNSYLMLEQDVLAAQTLQAKQAVYSNLQAIFDQLIPALKDKHQNSITNYKNEIDFLQSLDVYQLQTTISMRRTTFLPIETAFAKLTPELKHVHEGLIFALRAKHEDYNYLIMNKILSDTSELGNTDKILARLQNAEDLKVAAMSDGRLWHAIAKSTKSHFSQELIGDLLAIKKFHEERATPDNDLNFGPKYNESFHRFYEEALKIRLSHEPVKTQVQKLVDSAHKEFEPRHKTRRFIADALMLISVLFGGLGLAIMAGRYFTNRTVFFSTAATDRETVLINKWINPACREQISEKETRVFNTPLAVV